jgi:hypothetical protein
MPVLIDAALEAAAEVAAAGSAGADRLELCDFSVEGGRTPLELSLRDMVTTAISVAISLITIQENEVTKRLAGYAALVAVPTMVAGIYGMNFGEHPQLDWIRGGLHLFSIMLIGSFPVMLFFFRKYRWL